MHICDFGFGAERKNIQICFSFMMITFEFYIYLSSVSFADVILHFDVVLVKSILRNVDRYFTLLSSFRKR